MERETFEPHSGQVFWKRKFFLDTAALFQTTFTTAGITSPAFSMTTVSPMRMSFFRGCNPRCAAWRG